MKLGARIQSAIGWLVAAGVLLGAIPAIADVTGVKITKEEAITIAGTPVLHLTGVLSGEARRNEPGIPTLDHVVGLKYESDFDLWMPAHAGNGRFWFSILNRGNEAGSVRNSVLQRGGVYASCAWQAKNVAAPKPQLKLSGYEGPMPQAYGLVVIRDFVTFFRYAPGSETMANPLAGKIHFAFATGISQSGRLMRSFLLHGLNTAPQGKVFDALLPNGARAGYIDLFRPESDPGSGGGTFTAETVYEPFSWSDLMARSGTDAKVFALNAENEYYEMMAFAVRRGPVPPNVRLYDFTLGSHGGGGTVPWSQCIAPLSIALEEWTCNGTPPPDSRLFTMQKTESPRVKHLPSVDPEIPAVGDLGIAMGGVRLPPVDVPLARYIPAKNGSYKPEPLDKEELTRRYGTPEGYRKKVAECVDRLIKDRFLPESAKAKYVADAEKVSW
ncbi:MAG TPA: alpha/beta hydrolase domain-containing protein [Tepidisphaeraceae bacterium]|jgi:hypothetical protein|nr:alpha/beta hydrolase domain-containing protein [Tepidisphaeraceae bacterium]